MKINVQTYEIQPFDRWLSDTIKMELFVLKRSDGWWSAQIAKSGQPIEWSAFNAMGCSPIAAVADLIKGLEVRYGTMLKLELTPACIAAIEEATK